MVYRAPPDGIQTAEDNGPFYTKVAAGVKSGWAHFSEKNSLYCSCGVPMVLFLLELMEV
jgi:hypothetical protein